jgi:uncharacterized repeat protein (TIGR01451 family)
MAAMAAPTYHAASQGASTVRRQGMRMHRFATPVVRFVFVSLCAFSAAHALEPTTLAIATTGADPSEFGQGVVVRTVLNATGGTPTGTVTIGDGIDSCTATLPETGCLFRSTVAGTLTLTAHYSGDATFAASTSPGAVHHVASRTFPRRVSLGMPAINKGTLTASTSAQSISADGRYLAFTSAVNSVVTGDLGFTDDVFVTDRVTGRIEPVSRGLSGALANGTSDSARISADGRYITFLSRASNLVANDTNGVADIFVYDRTTAQISLVSVGASGEPANAQSREPVISADGRFVAFTSSATNLVAPATTFAGIFVRDRLLGQTYHASVTSAGVPANQTSDSPALSANGRYVAFESWASNLAGLDTNNTTDVFRHDLQTGTTVLVSVADGGSSANADSHNPSLSADGSSVAFDSYASNLVPGDTSTRDVFVRHVPAGTTTRVSVTPAGTTSNNWSYWPSLSDDGRYVAFGSEATNLVAGDTNGDLDAFVRDLAGATTTRVSVSTLGTPSDSDITMPFLSADGRYVGFGSEAWSLDASDLNDFTDVFVYDTQTATMQAGVRMDYGTQAAGKSSQARIVSAPGARFVAFTSRGANLAPGDITPLNDAFVRNLDTGATERISVASDGGQANSDGYWPQISSDGRYAAFYSYATNIAGGDSFALDVFARDRQAATTELVSRSSSGQAGNNQSSGFALSGNGRYVAFHSTATNLVVGDNNGQRDIFLRDRDTNTTTRVSVSSSGQEANGASLAIAISNDGNLIAFASDATNLAAGDTNAASDVYLRDVAAGTTVRISNTAGGAPGNGTSTDPAMSPDGRYVAFMSAASNLVAGDTNSVRDIFVYDRQTQQMSLVSKTSAGVAGNDTSTNPEISNAPAYVVFSSAATNLAAGDTNGVTDTFVHQLDTGTTLPLSVTASGIFGNAISDEAAISADGREITFYSDADNLVAGDTNGASDVFLLRNPLNPAATTTAITQQQPATTVTGQSYLVDVQVSADDTTPAGAVTVNGGDGGPGCTATLIDGRGSCTLQPFTGGVLTLTANYAGARGLAASQATATHTVNPAATTTALSISPTSGVSGQNVTLLSTLGVVAPGAGTISGTVSFYDGAALIGTAPVLNNLAMLSRDFAAGSHTLIAVFDGNASHAASSSMPSNYSVAPAAQLSVTLDDTRTFVAGGGAVSYTLVVRNAGPDTTSAARVRNVLPANLADVDWTCAASNANCGASLTGSGAIDALVLLSPGGTITFTITGTALAQPEQPLVHTATVEAQNGVIDVDPGDNSASDTTAVGIFADGFAVPAGR